MGKWFFVEQVHAFFKYDSYDSSTYVLFLIFRLIWGNEIQLNESASVGWRSLVDTLGPAFSWADLWIVLHARDPMVTELSRLDSIDWIQSTGSSPRDSADWLSRLDLNRMERWDPVY